MVFAVKGCAGYARDRGAGAGFALEESGDLGFEAGLAFCGQGVEVIDDGLE